MTPSRMSSAEMVTPLGLMPFVFMKPRTARFSADFSPASCVPPEPVGMPLA